MPTVQPIAVLVSDLHLSIKQPACRADDDWLEVQERYLAQLRELQIQEKGKIPVICAGDIFDRWNPPPELIHFALKYLPNGMICVPGQHDLPNHVYEEMHRSGYGVLVEAKKIEDISECQYHTKHFTAVGYPWGVELGPCLTSNENSVLNIAVVHRYCWNTGSNCYPGAPEENHISKLGKALQGYNVAVFGDNHEFFNTVTNTGLRIYNCGGFIRRKSDEIDYVPRAGILYSNGKIKTVKYDTSRDKFHDPKTVREELPIDMKGLIDELKGLGEHGLNFKDEVLRHLDREKVDGGTRKAVLEALEE